MDTLRDAVMNNVMIAGIFSFILIVVWLIVQIATAPHIHSDDPSESETEERFEEANESRKAEALREVAQHSLNLNMMAMDSFRQMAETARMNQDSPYEGDDPQGASWYRDAEWGDDRR